MQNYQTKNRQSSEGGFTLIEMSIVLVIIGLIVAGVLVGQDLIAAAKNRALISQLQSYDAAVNTFQLKFNAVPGDMTSTNASAFLGGLTGGDGDGQVEDGGGSTDMRFFGDATTSGVNNFFYHLGLAKIVERAFTTTTANVVAGTNVPTAKVGSGLIFAAYSGTKGGHYWFITGGNGTAAVSTLGALFGDTALTAQEAFTIDSKLDDSAPNTGIVVALNHGTPTDAVEVVAQTASASTCNFTGDIYNLQASTRFCNIAAKISGI